MSRSRQRSLTVCLGSALTCWQLGDSPCFIASTPARSTANQNRGRTSTLQPGASAAPGRGGSAVVVPGLALAAFCAAARSGHARAASGRGATKEGTELAEVQAKPQKKKKENATDPTVANINWDMVSDEWEVDCFSRPVIRDGKKMWELMLTDANGIYRRVVQMKPTRVNSVVVQKLLTIFIEEAKIKPISIRFYRKVMKNMLTVSLTNIKDTIADCKGLKILPSRNCHMLRLWLEYRQREVYPKLPGYSPVPARRSAAVQSSLVQVFHEPIPKKISFSSYVISQIPLGSLAEIQPGQLPGELARIPPGYSDTTPVHGIMIYSARAEILCAVLESMELAGVRLNADSNELLMDIGIDATYKIEDVSPEAKESCLRFERGKRNLRGLHFIAVHNPFTGGEPALPTANEEESEGRSSVTGLWLCIDYAPQDEA